jgi:rhodanese-related sulfurtransferase
VLETTNPSGAKRLLDSEEGWTYVDVRSPEEYGEGHVTGAVNVPIALRSPAGGMAPNPEFLAVMKKKFSPDARLVLGCAAGGRSRRAGEILEEAGFRRLVNMHGGFSGARDPAGQVVERGWADCGFPTESGQPSGRAYADLKK